MEQTARLRKENLAEAAGHEVSDKKVSLTRTPLAHYDTLGQLCDLFCTFMSRSLK